jgi:hypothetical protein
MPKSLVVTEGREIDHAPNWQMAAKAVMEVTGVALPEYDERGGFFTLGADGSLRVREALCLSRTSVRVGKLRKALQAVRTC